MIFQLRSREPFLSFIIRIAKDGENLVGGKVWICQLFVEFANLKYASNKSSK